MTLTIELPDDQAKALEAQAQAQGLSLEALLRKMAEGLVAAESIADLQLSDPREWGRRFKQWADGHDRSTPLLSDEAVSRENLYSDRF